MIFLYNLFWLYKNTQDAIMVLLMFLFSIIDKQPLCALFGLLIISRDYNDSFRPVFLSVFITESTPSAFLRVQCNVEKPIDFWL